MRSFLPSRLDLKCQERTVQLQFKGNAFELYLFHRGNAVSHAVHLTAAQLRQVSIDLRPVEAVPLKLLYEGRHVVIELKGHVWIRIPDIQFLRLVELAIDGKGASMEIDPKRLGQP